MTEDRNENRAPALRDDAPKTKIEGGGAALAINPQTFEDAWRISRALGSAGAGEMIPDAFREKPDAILAAMMTGAEVGLSTMQSLKSIAVINGRACLWGDALPAIILKAGHQIDHEVVGEGDDRKAVATLIRGDTGQKVVREFSVADAKRAGLWSPEARVTRYKKGGQGTYEKDNDSPWHRYPDRMLGVRARAFAMRDGAPDAIMGLRIAEEERDVEAMKDVTPTERADAVEKGASQLADFAARKRAEAAKPEPEAETPVEAAETVASEADDVEIEGEAEEVSPDAETAAEGPSEDASEADPEELVAIRTAGRDAFAEGFSRSDNPHKAGDMNVAAEWDAGWVEVHDAEAIADAETVAAEDGKVDR